MNRTLADTIHSAQHYLDPQQVNCVVYHSPCNDGSGAAVAAWMALGDKATYVRRIYHKEFPKEELRGKRVIVLDASFKRDELLELREITEQLMIVDHHHSAMLDIGHLPGCFFTMEHSGAVLSWHYFHGLNVPPPSMLRLIEDRDLWRWHERDLSEPLYYALRQRSTNSDFKTYLPYVDQNKLDELIAFGKTLVESNHKWCEEAAKQAQAKLFQLPGDSKTYKIMCRELDNDNLVSELSEYLYTLHAVDFIMLWCKTGDQFKVSFRSNSPETNVGAIATALGGGGHKQAAGAVISYSPWNLTS